MIGRLVRWEKIWDAPADLWTIVVDSDDAGHRQVVIVPSRSHNNWAVGDIIHSNLSCDAPVVGGGCIIHVPPQEDVPDHVWAALARWRLMGEVK